MRPLLLCLIGLAALSPELAFAQAKQQPKAAAPAGNEVRYFTAIDGLLDGNADVILKETRQGKTLTAASLDVCYPVDEGLRAQGPLCRQPHDRRPKPDRHDAKPRRQAARRGEAHAQADRRYLRIPRSDHDRPESQRGGLDRQFRPQRKGIPGGPDPRRRHHGGAKGFHRHLAGIDRRAGEAGMRCSISSRA